MEVVHGIHGHGPEACPACAGTMRKAMVAPAVHFKGSGWAKKDRGAATRTKAAAKSDLATPSATSGETAPGSAGEAAPASTGDAAPASGPVTPSGGTD
jgi:predicted nucleic acid-binding Zn ribbon protein